MACYLLQTYPTYIKNIKKKFEFFNGKESLITKLLYMYVLYVLYMYALLY